MTFTFTSHREIAGQHAFLSASKHHWINYDDERMERTFVSAVAAAKGTELHNIASLLIKHRLKQPRTPTTMNMYVNDAIGFRMKPEVVLVYSMNAFGTADAISFRDNMLRIHDLKTGTGKTSINQLKVYAALFCLEYGFRPGEIDMSLCIYQNNQIYGYSNLDPDNFVDRDEIAHIMDKIIRFDKRLTELRQEALGD